jgi:hypothetical protein
MRTRPDRTSPKHPVGPWSDEGMATAELVVVLPVIVLALLTGVGAVSAMTTRMRCADAAAVAARLAARGETRPDVIAAARRVAAPGAVVRLDTTATSVRVTVTTTANVLPVGGLLPGFIVTGSFEQDREPGPPP